jgi:APA family basic amino acid/polyamine antiporter
MGTITQRSERVTNVLIAGSNPGPHRVQNISFHLANQCIAAFPVLLRHAKTYKKGYLHGTLKLDTMRAPSFRHSPMFRTKPVSELISRTQEEGGLKRVLGPLELILLGIGAIVGTGIFVITGVVAAYYSGPALVLSFVISGGVCALAALCYAEFAAMVPVAGSAYTYSYAALGELWAWIIGWDLILEYSVAIAAVAIGWSGYLTEGFHLIGLELPPALVNPPGVAGGFINLPALLIIAVITGLLILGVRESASVNNVIVAIKLSVILLFLYLGFSHINPANWQPFIPYGWQGVFTGAAIVFFAYIGFDAVSTAAEEVRNPQKDLPVGILGSLSISTLLYIAVSAVLTGVVSYLLFKETNAPVAFALEEIGITWGSEIIAVGAICGIASVLLVLLFGQSRIFFAMARDGLLPRYFSSIHPRFRTPAKVTLLVGAATAVIASLLPLEAVAELVNIGTLAAFIIVAAGVTVLRRTQPDLKRPFRVPLVPLIPAACIISCGYLILSLPTITHLRFIIWLIIGLGIYFAYGRYHSSLAEGALKNAD